MQGQYIFVGFCPFAILHNQCAHPKNAVINVIHKKHKMKINVKNLNGKVSLCAFKQFSKNLLEASNAISKFLNKRRFFFI